MNSQPINCNSDFFTGTKKKKKEVKSPFLIMKRKLIILLSNRSHFLSWYPKRVDLLHSGSMFDICMIAVP